MINVLKYKKIYFIISLLVIVPGIISLIFNGLNLAIDFTGGSLIEIAVPKNLDQESSISAKKTHEQEAIDQSIDLSKYNKEYIQNVLEDEYEIESVQQTNNNSLIIRGEEINNDQKNKIINQLNEQDSFIDLRFETIGPTLGRELLYKTLIGIALVTLFIIVYVWKQFKDFKFGICAVLAMFHDSIILLGSFSILGYLYNVEIDVLFVTALLTTLSFSIHDTIVVYDRIRELRDKNKRKDFYEIANMAVVETLSRSINNSVTIILMLLSLVLLGGSTIYWFSVALLIGAVVGTYSSTFTAVPLLVTWIQKNKNQV